MAQDNLRYYEDVELGDEIGPLEKDLSDEAVAAFCGIWGTGGPNRFTDVEEAKKSRLPGPIVPGIMTMAVMAQLLTGWSSSAALKQLDVVFRQTIPHKPATISAVVTDKREEDGEHLIECDVILSNEESGRLVGGKAVLSLPSRDT